MKQAMQKAFVGTVVAALVAIVVIHYVKPEWLSRAKGAIYAGKGMQLFAAKAAETQPQTMMAVEEQELMASRAIADMARIQSASQASQASTATADALAPSAAGRAPNRQAGVIFRHKEDAHDSAGHVVHNTHQTLKKGLVNNRVHMHPIGVHNGGHTKHLVPQDKPRTVGTNTIVPGRKPASINPTQQPNEQFHAYRNAVQVNPRMVVDAKDWSRSRAFANRNGASTGVYATVYAMMENSGAVPRAADVLNCDGVPLLGLDADHPCYSAIHKQIYAEDHARVAYPVQ